MVLVTSICKIGKGNFTLTISQNRIRLVGQAVRVSHHTALILHKGTRIKIQFYNAQTV